MKTSESIKQIAPSILSAQKSIRDAHKNADNPFFKSKFANLESVWDAVRQALHDNDISCVQTFNIVEGCAALDTTLLHISGEWISGTQLLNEIKKDPQATGAAATYARRKGLSAIIGVIETDDDGESAMGRGNQLSKQEINKLIQEAGHALANVKTKEEAMKVWTTIVSPIYNHMTGEEKESFEKAKERIKRELR